MSAPSVGRLGRASGGLVVSPSARVVRVIARVSLGLAAIVGAFIVYAAPEHASQIDYQLYVQAARHFLATGDFYSFGFWTTGGGTPGIHFSPVLYPPIVLYLLVPFTVLPPILWWVIPIGVTAAAILRLRPAEWTWPFIAAAFVWPRTAAILWFGNPGLWVVMFVALGCLYEWPAVLVLLKPSLAPFALVGIRSRGWWLGLGILGVASVPLLGLWTDYVSLLARMHLPLSYSLLDVPTTALPFLAWLGRDGRVPSLDSVRAVVRHSVPPSPAQP